MPLSRIKWPLPRPLVQDTHGLAATSAELCGSCSCWAKRRGLQRNAPVSLHRACPLLQCWLGDRVYVSLDRHNMGWTSCPLRRKTGGRYLRSKRAWRFNGNTWRERVGITLGITLEKAGHFKELPPSLDLGKFPYREIRTTPCHPTPNRPNLSGAISKIHYNLPAQS